MHVMDVRCTVVDVPKDTEWNEESKRLENIDQPSHAMSLTTPPASLILRLKRMKGQPDIFVCDDETEDSLSLVRDETSLDNEGQLGQPMRVQF